MNDLFDNLAIRLQAIPDRYNKEYHFTCVNCGHESTPRSPHCSMSRKGQGWFCFVCGSHGSIKALAKLVGIENDERPHNPPKRCDTKTAESPLWQADPERYIREYEQHPHRFELWKNHKPVSEENIIENRLGVGILPSCGCHHPRLIVPIFSGTMCVGLRGRRLDCDCKEKWHVSKGTTLDRLPLYNESSLKKSRIVLLVENCVDAILGTQYTPYAFLATYSVAYWREGWTAALQAARPELVVVAFDNDLPGNGGGYRHGELVKRWFVDHPKATMIPESAGPRLANRLLEIGLPVSLFSWPDGVKDIGQMLSKKLCEEA